MAEDNKAENKFLVFGERVQLNDIVPDDDYETDVTRLGGNIPGIALRAPNNKALKQGTTMAATLGQYIADHSEPGTVVTDTNGVAPLLDGFNQSLQSDINSNVEVNTALVHTTGDESISGVKSFAVPPKTGQAPVQLNDLTNKDYVDSQDAATLKAAKDYTDKTAEQIRTEYDKKIEDALNEAKDYTDDQLEISGGGGSGTGGAVLPPTIISPMDGADDVLISSELTAGPFRSAYAENTRTARQFQLTKTDFGSCIVDKEVNADSLTLDENMEPNSDYKWRCRDKSSFDITSDWSAVAAFTTGGELVVVKPTLTVEGAPSNVAETPLLTLSEFTSSDGGDTYEASEFRIIRTSDSKTVWTQQGGAELTMRVPAGVLQTSTAYTAEGRQKGAKYNWSKWSDKVSFTTQSQFTHIDTPTVTIDGGLDNVGKNPTFHGSAFTVVPSGEDTHTSSTWVIKRQGGAEIYRLEKSSEQKTTLTLQDNVLTAGGTYEVYLTYYGTTYGASAAGKAVFTCMPSFEGVAIPSIKVLNTTAENMDANFVFQGSEFNFMGPGTDTCDKVDWELYQGDSKVWSEANSIKLRHLGTFPGYTLTPSTKYVIKYRQHAKANDKWSQWAELTFTTANPFLPTIKFTMKNLLNLSKIFIWWDADNLQVYKNGELQPDWGADWATDRTLSPDGDLIEIKNKTEDNYPYLIFNGKDAEYDSLNLGDNLISIDAPFPLLRKTSHGDGQTDFGGDAGDPISKGRGQCWNCTSLTGLVSFQFKNNPQITNFGGMGGGGGGSGGYTTSSYDAGTGGNGGGKGGGKGGKGGSSGVPGKDGGNGINGWGCFSYCKKLKSIPNYLFACCVNVVNFGGYGGGGGGVGCSQGSGKGGQGGKGVGCFAFCINLETVNDYVFIDCISVINFGGMGGGGGGSNAINSNKGGDGGDGIGCFAECHAIKSVSYRLFTDTVNVLVFGGYGGVMNTDPDSAASSGKGGKGVGCFANCISFVLENAANLFNNCPNVNNWDFYSAKTGYGHGSCGGGGAGYYGGGGGGGEKVSVANGGNGGNGYYQGGQSGGTLNGSFSGGGGGGYGGAGRDGYSSSGGAGGPSKASSPSSNPDNTEGLFAGCIASKSIPVNLLRPFSKVVNLQNTFKGCTALTISVRLSAANIPAGQAAGFASGTAAKGTVYVPSGSTTAATFKADASTNVNVVEE